MSTPQWTWWLCNSSDMSQIAQLNVHDKELQLQLNNQGKATGWVHLLDPDAPKIVEHQTCIRADRNNVTVWSGEIISTNETSQASAGQQQGQDQLQFTATGWFDALNARLVHTGDEFQTMLTSANGFDWQAEFGDYIPLGTDGATQLAYSVAQNSSTTDAAIIFDLLDRANIDGPTLVQPGSIFGSPVQRNLTLQRFQNVGQQITQLSSVESGVDFIVDPLTRNLHLYGVGASSTFLVPNGYGVDRGQGCLFSYPGNCTMASRSRDGKQTRNREEAMGQFGVGRADDIGSQGVNRIREGTDNLAEVVDTNILIAYAQAEVAVKRNPWTIITFQPRPVTEADATAPGVPRPFDDYTVGDIVYCQIRRGSMLVGDTSPQPTRVFGFTLSIDDSGTERVTQIQTTFQSS